MTIEEIMEDLEKSINESKENIKNYKENENNGKKSIDETLLRYYILSAEGKEEQYFYPALDRNIKKLYELKCMESKEYKKAYKCNLYQFIKGINVFYNNKLDEKAKAYVTALYELDNELFNSSIKNGLFSVSNIVTINIELLPVCEVSIKITAKEFIALFAIITITVVGITIVGLTLGFLASLVPAVIGCVVTVKSIFNKLTNKVLRRNLRNK